MSGAAVPSPSAEPSAVSTPTPLISGIKLLAAGAALRHFSPNLFGIETPLLIGTAGNAAFIVGVLAVLLLPLLDFFAGPRGWPSFMHSSATDWLNQAKAFETNGRIQSRAAVLLGCLARAAGEEALFRYALPTLVPPLGALNGILRLPFPMPMGHLVSVVAYAWYKCGGRPDSRAEAFGLAALGYSVASLEAGLVAAVGLNFVVGVGMVSFYLYAKNAER